MSRPERRINEIIASAVLSKCIDNAATIQKHANKGVERFFVKLSIHSIKKKSER